MNSSENRIAELTLVGWREFLSLPELGIRRIKAKVDTGARSSSLHATQIESFQVGEQEYVRFQVTPLQRSDRKVITAQAPVLEYRHIRSSSGQASERPVILTSVQILGHRWEIELTLADRSEMGFRMLLGREAVRGRCLVDPGRSYYGGLPRAKRSRGRGPQP